MSSITVNGKTQSFSDDKRLLIALQEMGINIGHRCGGNARCTTCRVEISTGEPDAYTKAEYTKLKDADLLGKARLACQLTCSNDMDVTVLMTKESEGWPDTGPAIDAAVQPEAQWFSKEEIEKSEG